MNISEKGIRAYIEKFHETLSGLAKRFFTLDQAKQLLHESLLPAKVVCYVSTQFGVAFEYTRAETTTIETVLGSARIEDLVVQAPKRLRKIGPLIIVGVSNVLIASLTLANGFPFRLTSIHANITFRDVQFTYAALEWARIIEYVEVFGNRLEEHWSVAQAENRAKDEVLAALCLNQKANEKRVSLHEYISSSREKVVLLLGSYDEMGKVRLAAIGQILKDLNYEPILIENVPDFEHYDLAQKVTAIGALSRFIVIEDSVPSGHLNEVEICRQNRWVTIFLRFGGARSSWMTAGASYASNVILEKEYQLDTIKEAISESVNWAEARLTDMKSKLNTLYPWRTEV